MKRSLPLSTPSPNDQLKLQMSVENSQVAEEFTPPKSHGKNIAINFKLFSYLQIS